MASSASRSFLVALFLALIGLAAAASPGLRGPESANAQLIEQFTTQLPAKLHVGDFSHGDQDNPLDGQAADANPAAGGTVGYCVFLDISGLAPLGPNNGFTVSNGSVQDSDFFSAGTPSSVDDIYCVTVFAGSTVDPDTGFGKMVVTWNYTDGTLNHTLDLEIELFAVKLIGKRGAVGGAAEVCTMNWDPDILTGSVSNDGTLPDAVDDVTLGDPTPSNPAHPDWIIDDTGATWSGGPGTITKLGQFRKAPDGREWCMTFATDKAVDDLKVSLLFDAVYNRATNSDDQPHAPFTLVNVVESPPELRHVTPSGQLAASQDSNENVIGSRHYVCIVPSDADDLVEVDDINFSGNGPTTTDLQIFHDGDANYPNFPGVVDGTICLGWISTAPGEQFLDLHMTVVGGLNPGVYFVDWDSDNDNNDDDDDTDGPSNGALIIQWNVIDKTEISTSNDPDNVDAFLTYTRSTRNLQFNIGDGTFFAGDIDLNELVFGSHTGATGHIDALLDGVLLTARITSQCGYFLVKDVNANPALKTLTGKSVQGRFDVDLGPDALDGLYDGLTITTTNDPACNPTSILRVEVDATYPGPIGSATGLLHSTEWVEFDFNFSPAFKTPRVAWAGTTVTTVFALGGNCDAFLPQTVYFTRSGGQSGTFVPNGQVSVTGPDSAQGKLDPDTCSISAGYHSEEQGEVDIFVAFSANPYAQIAHPIFFLAFEDVTLTSSPELVVSQRGDLTADVRGWFTGNNPSGNPARVTDDGRALPLDRWVLPDDWDRLRGASEFRPSWANSAPMPLLNVTFFMENEGTRNNFQTGVKDGGNGWFLLDLTESSLNVNPFNGKPSVLGSVDKPRIITDLTDNDGVATVDLFGDLNLSYEGCEINEATGNPHCGIDDLVGVTNYYAVAEYPGDVGKYPPAKSNLSETRYFWAGYKEVTVQDTGLPYQKYVVAHLKDRDGFCDALSFNNTLGQRVRFLLDSGTGIAIEAKDIPSGIAVDGRDAWATTFDTQDAFGNAINVELAKTVLFEDECQAWIRVSSSLLKPLNVLAIFDAPPSDVPGDIRITGSVCSGDSVTVTNFDDHLVSLAGFGLRSRGSDITNPEGHLDLIGHLAPGESKTFLGGEPNGWQFEGDTTFNDSAEYARLVWNEIELSYAPCFGTVTNTPASLPLKRDAEGEIWIDTVVEFGAVDQVPLSAGWNLLAHGGDPVNVGEAFHGHEGQVGAVYAWDSATGRWERHLMTAPAYANSFNQFEPGVVYWVEVKEPFTLYLGK